MPRALSTTSSGAKSAGRSALHQHQQEHLDTSRPSGEEVTSINTVIKGFFCLIGGKRLCHYSKIADSWDFAKTREYVIPSSEPGTDRSLNSDVTLSNVSNDKQQMNNDQMMWKVVVSPKEEHILVLTSKQQIYAVSDITKDPSAESRVNLYLVLCFCNLYLFILGTFSIGISF